MPRFQSVICLKNKKAARSSSLFVLKNEFLVSLQIENRILHVVRLRQNVIFDLRRVGDKSVGCADSFDGRFQIFKQFVSYSRGDFRSVAPGNRIFMRDDNAACAFYRFSNRFPIVRHKRAQINNFSQDSSSQFQFWSFVKSKKNQRSHMDYHDKFNAPHWSRCQRTTHRQELRKTAQQIQKESR